MAPHRGTTLCRICQKPRPATDVIHGELIHGPVMELIKKRHPDWSPQDVVCLSCLNRIRAEYVEDVLQSEKGELSTLEEEVIKSLRDQEILSQNLNVEFDSQLTVGQRVADKVAEFGGSWGFILTFGGMLVLWIAVNSIALLRQPFDPYPYILLNLVLSCLAAIQAPVIMMSQNRQEAKDRLRAEHDYQVNLKAELEIRHLTWKMDQLLNHQWQRLLEIQKIQTELMEELLRKPSRGRGD
jgi:uncharacterized membrane protein